MKIKGFENVGVKEFNLGTVDIVLLRCTSAMTDREQVKKHMDNAVSAYVEGKVQHLDFVCSEKDDPWHRVIIFYKEEIQFTY